jgi:hypothetical protein
MLMKLSIPTNMLNVGTHLTLHRLSHTELPFLNYHRHVCKFLTLRVSVIDKSMRNTKFPKAHWSKSKLMIFYFLIINLWFLLASCNDIERWYTVRTCCGAVVVEGSVLFELIQ